jgi:3-oxoacyl-[acyl-carrier protein] reductase
MPAGGAGQIRSHGGNWAHRDRHGRQPRHRRGDGSGPGRGDAVLCTFLRVRDPADPGTPQAYRDHRAHDAAAVIAGIRDDGGQAAAVEADLSDPAAPALLFDAAEERFGPVDILVNNATGWLADSFAPAGADRLGRSLQPVTAGTWTAQFTVDAMGAALMISEFARRHIARQATWAGSSA